MKITEYADRTFLVLPPGEHVMYRGDAYLRSLRNEIERMRRKLPQSAVSVMSDTARFLRLENVQWVQSVPYGDLFFAKRHCVGMQWEPPRELIIQDKVIQDLTVCKFPGRENLTERERFKLLTLRRTFAEKRVLLKEKLILSIFTKTISREALLIAVDTTGTTRAYIGGKGIDLGVIFE